MALLRERFSHCARRLDLASRVQNISFLQLLRASACDDSGLSLSEATGSFFEPNLALRPRCYEIGFRDYPLAGGASGASCG